MHIFLTLSQNGKISEFASYNVEFGEQGDCRAQCVLDPLAGRTLRGNSGYTRTLLSGK